MRTGGGEGYARGCDQRCVACFEQRDLWIAGVRVRIVSSLRWWQL